MSNVRKLPNNHNPQPGQPTIQQVVAVVDHLNQQLSQVIRSHNNMAQLLTIACQFLDEKFAGWDKGFRDEQARKVQDLIRFKEILKYLADESQGLADRKSDAELIQFADELWAIAGRNGAQVEEAPRVASVYLQAKCTDGCRRVLRHLVDDDGCFLEGLNPDVYEAIDRRCSELEATQETAESEAAS